MFSYIGVSKLSCKPCYHWISAYNEERNCPKYHTKGCCDKWYPGWKRPLLNGIQQQFDETFSKMVAQDFCDHLVDQEMATARSNFDSMRYMEYLDMADVEAMDNGWLHGKFVME
jgi:nucleic acid/nucleotide deaminase of polymorphic system toxin